MPSAFALLLDHWLTAIHAQNVDGLCCPHAFRHTVASLLLNNGVDMVSVADFVGDDPATVAKQYAHLVNAGKQKASATMAAILGFTEQNPTQNAD